MRQAFGIRGWTALAAILCSQGPAAAGTEEQTWSQDPGTHCRFVTPASLTSGPTFWTGACTDGKASGMGMLRRRDGDHAGSAFFGRMRDGLPQVGVVDLGDGYRAGAFDNGDIGGEAELEPQVRINAFRAAAEAARLLSARFAAEKNAASAQHYQALAKTFELQIEE